MQLDDEGVAKVEFEWTQLLLLRMGADNVRILWLIGG